jgi:hypothetical protein
MNMPSYFGDTTLAFTTLRFFIARLLGESYAKERAVKELLILEFMMSLVVSRWRIGRPFGVNRYEWAFSFPDPLVGNDLP